MRIRWRDPQMSRAKWLKAAALMVGTFVVVFAVGSPILDAYLLVHPYRLRSELTTEHVGRPVERVTFTASDGLPLVGWFVPGAGDGATIVVSHGLGGSGPVTYDRYRFLSAAGYHVMVLDHRAHGQSGGRASTLGYLEARDVVGAVAYLRTRPDVDPERIGATGCSMGSVVVIGAAAQEPAIRAVAPEAVFADGRELWDRFGYVAVRGTPLHWSWGAPMRALAWLWTGERPAAFQPEALIGQISPRPVLIIQGENDNGACTVADAQRLYAAAGEPKALWIVPGGTHCYHPDQTAEYERRMLAFFDQHLLDGK